MNAASSSVRAEGDEDEEGGTPARDAPSALARGIPRERGARVCAPTRGDTRARFSLGRRRPSDNKKRARQASKTAGTVRTEGARFVPSLITRRRSRGSSISYDPAAVTPSTRSSTLETSSPNVLLRRRRVWDLSHGEELRGPGVTFPSAHTRSGAPGRPARAGAENVRLLRLRRRSAAETTPAERATAAATERTTTAASSERAAAAATSEGTAAAAASEGTAAASEGAAAAAASESASSSSSCCSSKGTSARLWRTTSEGTASSAPEWTSSTSSTAAERARGALCAAERRRGVGRGGRAAAERRTGERRGSAPEAARRAGHAWLSLDGTRDGTRDDARDGRAVDDARETRGGHGSRGGHLEDAVELVVGEVEDAADVVLLAPDVFLHLGVHRARVSAPRGGGVRHPSHLLEGGVAAEEVGLVALGGVARQGPHHGAIGLEVVAEQIPRGFVARASAASPTAPAAPAAASAPSATAAVLLIVLLVPSAAAAAPAAPPAASSAAPASPSSALIIQGGIRVPAAPAATASAAAAAAAIVVVVLVPASSASSAASSPATATPPTGTHRSEGVQASVARPLRVWLMEFAANKIQQQFHFVLRLLRRTGLRVCARGGACRRRRSARTLRSHKH